MLKIAWSPDYVLPVPPTHRFPMSKYEVLPQQLLYEGTVTKENFFAPVALDTRWILNTHTADYWHRLSNLLLTSREIRRTGFTLTQATVDREIIIAEGTRQCCLYALQYGVAMNIAGGTHHAFTHKGEGFCLLNDMAIAANFLLHENLARKILIIDLDVHQGNGTAEIFRNDNRVFTFSMHGANNYPLIKENSDLDIALADGTEDNFYLLTLQSNLSNILQTVEPDFIFFQSGVDVLASDKLGKLALSREGCKKRDNIVLQTCKQNSIPIVVCMGGGYSVDFRDIIEAHANTYRLAQSIFF
jgi:acetoin utilization deacetylase AcuC-like enzyme